MLDSLPLHIGRHPDVHHLQDGRSDVHELQAAYVTSSVIAAWIPKDEHTILSVIRVVRTCVILESVDVR